LLPACAWHVAAAYAWHVAASMSCEVMQCTK